MPDERTYWSTAVACLDKPGQERGLMTILTLSMSCVVRCMMNVLEDDSDQKLSVFPDPRHSRSSQKLTLRKELLLSGMQVRQM